ncbi:PGAM [Seminavis robusta]|uniref:PGAM n=1 Tax=Seminavis robusta TaxID=568900 RepID=A0A9N8HE50_9STRA|nr:PGAM [Seminavis robusta]|eukprot:Sro389_g132640.1 PGAM (336) ;mRNA; r:42874-43881
MNNSDTAAEAEAPKHFTRTSSVHRRRTLYLVRHGQALHNVKEAEAQETARQMALQQQPSCTPDEIAQQMEAARKAVLQDATLFDAPLTALGRQQAKQAGEYLAELIDRGVAPPPTEAMVSPLSRCLETADILLQQHLQHEFDIPDDDEDPSERLDINNEATKDNDNTTTEESPRRGQRRSTLLVHIRPEIQERQTQYPPDTPQTPDQLYHWTQQQQQEPQEPQQPEQQLDNNTDSSSSSNNYRFHHHGKALTGHALQVEESRTQLRERASKLFDVLMEMSHRHVLIISHKGYLREMERGLLGLTDSPLFDNAEVRVYHVVFTRGDRSLESVERLA